MRRWLRDYSMPALSILAGLLLIVAGFIALWGWPAGMIALGIIFVLLGVLSN